MARSLRNLILAAAIFPLSYAVPPPDTSAPLHSSLYERPVTRPSPSFFSPLRNLRDAIIERIWDVPSKSRPKSCHNRYNAVPSNYRARYGDDVVLRFKYETEEEVAALAEAVEVLYLDVWEQNRNWTDIRLSKDVLPSLLGLLPKSLHKASSPVMHDLAQAVYDTYPQHAPVSHHQPFHPSLPFHYPKPPPTSNLFFSDYQPLSVLYPWLRLTAAMFPSHAELTSIGLSSEGRDIPALRVGARTDLPPDHKHPTRETILITANTHAREWISVSTAAYMAYSLITRYNHPSYPDTTKLLDHFDLIFLPTLNPDGYEYTWTTDRLWRKNRQQTPLPFCPGIDLDHAFSYGWDGNDTVDNACAEDFGGTKPFEATEAMLLSDWARNQTEHNNVTFVAYLDLHSYSQEVLYPYSFSCDAEPPNLEDLEEVAFGLAKSFWRGGGRWYGVDSACEGPISLHAHPAHPAPVPNKKIGWKGLENQGGSALDYFYHDLRVKYAYQIKLRDQGTYGFLLPKEHIVPQGEEAVGAMMGLGRWLLGNHGIESAEVRGSVWGGEDEELLKEHYKSNGQDENDNVEIKGTMDADADEYEYDEEEEYQFELRRRRRRR